MESPQTCNSAERNNGESKCVYNMWNFILLVTTKKTAVVRGRDDHQVFAANDGGDIMRRKMIPCVAPRYITLSPHDKMKRESLS